MRDPNHVRWYNCFFFNSVARSLRGEKTGPHATQEKELLLKLDAVVPVVDGDDGMPKEKAV
jgi:hypothetical protein